MKLGFFNARTNHYGVKRKLTTLEISTHEGFRHPIVEARNRLVLFRILDSNFKDWRNYLNSLLSAGFREKGEMSDELNRLLLNYLTAAYTIQEHFRVSFTRKFRKDGVKLKEFDDLVQKICDRYWEFGFILDYRHYVQHRGLAVGECNRTPTESSVSISITVNAASLIEDSRGKDWKFSNVTADRGHIDLIHAIRTFHIMMQQDYGMFVAKTFFPELLEADRFYMPLLKEVKASDPEATMIFITSEIKEEKKADGTIAFEFSCQHPPNDVFSELGLTVDRSKKRRAKKVH